MAEDTQLRGIWTSASNAEADLLCPGRYLAQADLPEEEQASDDAAFGNAIHEALKTNDPAKLSIQQHDIFESCQKIETKVVADYFGDNAPRALERCERERRYWFSYRGWKHSGQLDAAFRFGSKALIVDYKSLGSDIAGSPENLQLRDLAVLYWENTPLLSELAVCLIQPLVTHSPKLCLYTDQTIMLAEAGMIARVNASHDQLSGRVAGKKQCQFCRAKKQCGVYNDWAASGLPVPANYAHLPIDKWTPEMWTVFCRNKGNAAKWLKLAEEEAKRRLKANPNAIPGFCLKPGNKPRPITQPNELFAKCEAKGVTLEGYMECVTIGKEKLKAKVAAATKLKGKALEDLFEQLLEGCVDEYKQNDDTIAPIKEEK